MNLTSSGLKKNNKLSKMEKRRSVLLKIIYLLVIAVTVAADQITKCIATSYFEYEGQSVTAIKGLLDFTYVLNDGATAGMLSEHRWVFMSVSSVVIVAIVAYLMVSKSTGFFMGISFSMVAGGGIGNMIDRVSTGAVVDFFDVTAVNFFPFNCIFNVADVFVCVGCALLILAYIIEEVRESKKNRVQSAEETSGGDETDGTCNAAEK